MCKANLPPATASAQCCIDHPGLTLSILPPWESAPACRPHPPAGEDLEKRKMVCLFILSFSDCTGGEKKSSEKNKLLMSHLFNLF